MDSGCVYLVYEKNYLTGGDVDCVEEYEMEIFAKEEDAQKNMQDRKQAYEEEGFLFSEEDSTEEKLYFVDQTGDGFFIICMARLVIKN